MKEMVGLTGLEPVTSSLSGKRSNRLSYRPVCLAEATAEDYPNDPDRLKMRSLPEHSARERA